MRVLCWQLGFCVFFCFSKLAAVQSVRAPGHVLIKLKFAAVNYSKGTIRVNYENSCYSEMTFIKPHNVVVIAVDRFDQTELLKVDGLVFSV